MKAPTEPGYYWAKIFENWFIVEVQGRAPFFKLKPFWKGTFDLQDTKDIKKWGPKIEKPIEEK